MSNDAITTPQEKDLLEEELQEHEGIIFEETRHVALKHMIEKQFVQFTTKIEKNKFDKIMKMLTFVRMYKLEMKFAMEASEAVREAVLADCNLYLEQILDYMKLMKAKEGYTAEQIFGILRAEEKTAKKWGLFDVKKQDQELES